VITYEARYFVDGLRAHFLFVLKDLGPMAASVGLQDIVAASVSGLGYELVDFELSARGLMRVFIDKPNGIGVEDCASVSNHLTRVFVVENIDFERLEVSSPGLDRPLKSLANFQQYVGSAVKVRLNAMVDGRKRFDGVIEALEGATIVFGLIEDGSTLRPASRQKRVNGPKRNAEPSSAAERIRVPLESIDKARLIPDI
jgi:ribosome maturation factor RimP